MRLLLLGFWLLAWLAVPAYAGPSSPEGGAAEAPKGPCEVAEIHPVTGNVLCIKPFGAPVEAPKATEEAPCKPHSREDADWTWRPNCRG